MLDLMPITPGWPEIALRIGATLLAGILIGANREQGGHAAGLRTTTLVGLAACIPMIQANMLLATSQGVNGSMDILRFPLGILTGVGFIGGGAILRRGDIATGVTTAATLWVITAIGLCFGGGQIVIGAAATVLTLLILAPLRHIQQWMSCEEKSSVTIKVPKGSPIPDIRAALPSGSTACFTTLREIDDGDALMFEIRWTSGRSGRDATAIADGLRERFSVIGFENRSTIN
ncbi:MULTISPECIES: MgtC/SapB family protein [unclassified Rhizobium]|uniref:MgtC/SapB family protein n=1 Tax=unclassified Rhizobium TaxID=2613769 RepID=UPI000DBF6C0A|nr:MgtC/SapB family protein [Rhizobium sp. AN80A]